MSTVDEVDLRPCNRCGHLQSEHGDDLGSECLVGSDFLDPRPVCHCRQYEAPR